MLKLYRIELIDTTAPNNPPGHAVQYAHSKTEARQKCAKDLPDTYKLGKCEEVT